MHTHNQSVSRWFFQHYIHSHGCARVHLLNVLFIGILINLCPIAVFAQSTVSDVAPWDRAEFDFLANSEIESEFSMYAKEAFAGDIVFFHVRQENRGSTSAIHPLFSTVGFEISCVYSDERPPRELNRAFMGCGMSGRKIGLVSPGSSSSINVFCRLPLRGRSGEIFREFGIRFYGEARNDKNVPPCHTFQIVGDAISTDTEANIFESSSPAVPITFLNNLRHVVGAAPSLNAVLEEFHKQSNLRQYFQFAIDARAVLDDKNGAGLAAEPAIREISSKLPNGLRQFVEEQIPQFVREEQLEYKNRARRELGEL